jgi:hypothetical protein
VPVDHHPRREDHGFRIDVSRDGSMIMAVPIVVDEGGRIRSRRRRRTRRGSREGRWRRRIRFSTAFVVVASLASASPQPPRASPILFDRPRLSPSTSKEAGSSGSSSWPTRGLLDARGKQKRKMRSGGYATRPAAVAARRADATIHTAKDRLK